MVYSSLAGVLIAAAFVIIVFAGRFLVKGNWILGWLKGMTGLLLVGAAIFLTSAALDFYTYKTIKKDQPIATLGFTRLEGQHYKVALVDPDGFERFYDIKGDLWQLDARILKWNKAITSLGMPAGYRLDQLSGRYYSLEEEAQRDHSLYQLSPESRQVDIWELLHNSAASPGFLDASYANVTYLPMADGALFAVKLSNTGLVAQPLNDSAKDAVKSWQ